MASNRVGHFIYGLKDRIWSDFVCHFHLFKASIDYSYFASGWNVDEELGEILVRTPIAVKSNLGFLHKSAKRDHSTNAELKKFGLFGISLEILEELSHRRLVIWMSPAVSPASNCNRHRRSPLGNFLRIFNAPFKMSPKLLISLLESFSHQLTVHPFKGSGPFKGDHFTKGNGNTSRILCSSIFWTSEALAIQMTKLQQFGNWIPSRHQR